MLYACVTTLHTHTHTHILLLPLDPAPPRTVIAMVGIIKINNRVIKLIEWFRR